MATELRQDEKEYLADNYKTATVPDLAKHLKRGAATIYAYFKLKGWAPYKNPNALKRPASHPFRANNRKLENYHIARAAQRDPKTQNL